jgi:mannose-6-phosphate isomerase-like protein (cupin superfamily)
MSVNARLVHVDDVAPENMKKGDGWAISEFRLPISGKDGSSTTLFHSIFRPGSTHAKHLHRNCDEIAVYLKGRGICGQSSERTEVRPGHCRLMPKGSQHFFYNESKDEEGLVIGFYVGAKSVPDTGYEFCGTVTDEDLKVPRRDVFREGIMVNIADVKPTQMKGRAGDFRLPIGRHNGSPSALYWATLKPGEAHQKHRLDRCEELYYVIGGHGIVGAGSQRSEVRAGHVHYIPQGVERFMHNASKTEPLEVIGLYTGAGSLDEAGYVATGEISASDLRPS